MIFRLCHDPGCIPFLPHFRQLVWRELHDRRRLRKTCHAGPKQLLIAIAQSCSLLLARQSGDFFTPEKYRHDSFRRPHASFL